MHEPALSDRHEDEVSRAVRPASATRVLAGTWAVVDVVRGRATSTARLRCSWRGSWSTLPGHRFVPMPAGPHVPSRGPVARSARPDRSRSPSASPLRRVRFAQTRGNEERHFHRSIAGVRSELKPALTLHGAGRLDRGARSPSRGERPCRGGRVPVPSLVAATLDARATLARTGSRCLHRSSRDQA